VRLVISICLWMPPFKPSLNFLHAKFFTSKPLSAYLSQASVRTMLKKLVQRAFLPNRNRGTVLVLRESASTLKSTSLFVHKIHLFPFSHFPFSEPLFHVPTCILSRPFLFLSILCTVSSKHNPNLELSLSLSFFLSRSFQSDSHHYSRN